jgi:hypothetical protein
MWTEMTLPIERGKLDMPYDDSRITDSTEPDSPHMRDVTQASSQCGALSV